MYDLTPRQRQILELIQQELAQTGYPPTRSEIARRFGFRSANAAEQHLRALVKKGVIAMQPGASRGIRLLIEPGGEAASEPAHDGLPIIGQVAAGSPVLAEEHIDQYYPVAAGLFSPPADYLLSVRGLSMRDAGILEGDLLAVHRTTEARDGQIVVARLHDEVTVKRLEQRGHQVRLLPENAAFAPIEVDLRHEALELEGLGVGVIRPTL